MIRIAVISDTHTNSLNRLPRQLLEELTKADWVIHCGDYTSLALVRELQTISQAFVGVFGNVDPPGRSGMSCLLRWSLTCGGQG